jgi:hypothetical protein
MTRHSNTKLVPIEVRHEEQSLEAVEASQPDQSELSMSELDIETECPLCNDIMKLCSSFDKLNVLI